MKKSLSVLLMTVILVSFTACKKGETPVPQAPVKQGPIMDSPISAPGHGGVQQKIQFEVIVPQEVKDEWSAVKILIKDKKQNTSQEFAVKIGEELIIPDSKLTVKVVYFLPDFKMSGQIITSSSSSPNNPSAGIVISEDGKQIFPETGKFGWLYTKFPTIHPFQHERYELILKEGIKKQ